MLRKNSRIAVGGIGKLRLAAGGHQRTGDGTGAFLCQLLRNQVTLGAVYQDIVQMEFLCQTDGGEDVVGAVAVEMCLQLAFDDRHERIALGIKIRRVGVFVLLAPCSSPHSSAVPCAGFRG